MAVNCIAEIPGAAELSDWFGGFPAFHDAKADIRINGDGTGWLKAYGFRMTNKVDQKVFYVLEKNFVATFLFEELKSISLANFLPGLAILFDLQIVKSGDMFEIDIDSSYGFSGSLVCVRLRVEFEPDMRAP